MKGTTSEVENLTVEQPKEFKNSEFLGVDELSGSFGSRSSEESVKCTLPQNIQGKGGSCGTREMMNSHGVVVQEHPSAESLQSNSLQITAVVTLQRRPDTPPPRNCFEDATFIVKFADNIALKLDAEKCADCEETVSMKHPIEQSWHEVRNHGENVTMKSETALFSCSAMEDDLIDTGVVKEVVQDLVNYVVYEVNSVVFPKNF